MRRRTVLLLLVLVVAIGVLIAPNVALAWTDISDAEWITQYGITAAQVDTVADGFPDGTFRPTAQVTRGQFTKMAVNGLDVPTLSPATPTFSDVPRSHIFYTHIEGANAAGLVNGVGGGLFEPGSPISRQQVATILARWLSEAEIDELGYIAGSAGAHYASLNAWYAAEGAAALASFFDQASIATVHKPGVAYLAARDIAEGSGGYFNPTSNITRAQSAALILRVLAASDDFVPVPTVTDVTPDAGPAAGGTVVLITGTGFSAGATVKFGTATATGVSVNSATQIVATSPAGTAGTTVQVSVTTAAGTSANTAADNFTYEAGPTVTINQASGQADPTHTSPINFTVVFSEVVTDFATGDVTITGTAAGTLVGTVTGSGKTYNVAVTGMTGDGTVIASIAAGKAHNAASQASAASTSTDNTVTYDAGPTVTINQASGQDDPTHTSPIDFTVVFSATVTDFDDSSDVTITGTAGGTKTVTITGSGKTYNVAVSGMTSDGTVIASIPAGAAKDASSNGNAASTSTDHTVTWTVTGPVVTSLTDSAGDDSGGETVTIKGTGFGNDEDEVRVMFGGVEATVEDVNSSGTILEVEAPPGANHTVVDVRVITDEGTSPNTQADDYAYGEPVIDSLVPDSGPEAGGNKMIIAGTGFTADATVWFDTTKVASADVTVDSPTQITVEVPSGTDTDNVTVKNDEGTSNTKVYTYTEYVPFVTSLSKNAGSAGNSIYIYGGNFTDAATVAFGGTPATVTDVNTTHTRIQVTVPAETGTVDVLVTTVDGTSEDTPADDFAYGKPTITGLDPDVGDPDGGTVVVISGTRFTLDGTVTFGGVAAEIVSVNATNTQLTVIAPAGDDGETVDVKVTNDAGTTTESDAFTYDSDYNDPTVTDVTPDTGPSGGGTAVTITGTNFFAGSTVKFGTGSASNVVVVDENTITCDSHSGTAGATVQVKVTNAYGSSANTSADNFTYTAGPTVTINQKTSAPAQPDPTNASPINFTVVFSETVTDFDDASDVTITGTAGGTKTVVITPVSGTTYTVAVSGMTTDGTVVASIPAGVAQNGSAQPNAASTSTDHTVTYDTTDPTVTISQKTSAPAQPDPAGVSPINFTVVFSETVTDFATGDVDLSASTTPGTLVGTVTGSGTTYNVAVSGMTGEGIVTVSIAIGAAHDAAGNASAASTSSDDNVTWNIPTITSSVSGSNGTISPLGVTVVTYNGTQAYSITPDDGYTVADIVVDGTSLGGTAMHARTYVFTSVIDDHTIAVSFEAAVATTADHAQYRLGDAGTWTDFALTDHFLASWAGDTDLRVRVLDQYGFAIPNTDVSAGHPLYEFEDYATGIPKTDVVPVSSTTDASGYIFWYNKGSATGSWFTRLGLDLDNDGLFDTGDSFTTSHMYWDGV